MPKESDTPREYASPPCYAHELDPHYAGLLNNTEIIAALQELLEGERAGARIAKETLDEATTNRSETFTALIEHIRSDEASYCSMLMHQIEVLGGTPSRATGAFYEKCMAFEDVVERLAFLNRGQGWVVKRINELVPKLNGQDLLNALIEMRDTHESNISKTSRYLDDLSESIRPDSEG